MLRNAICVMFGASLVACSNSETPPMQTDDAPGELVASSKPRDTAPDTTDEELAELTADNADFAWAFYHRATEDGENLFFSPHSLSVALAMTWAGARGTTETQMAEAMRYRLGQARLHPAFNALDLELENRAEEGDEDAPRPFRLKVTNALFGQAGFGFLAPFLDTLAENYGAGLRLMDFATQTEEARLAINAWVSEQTEERIDELLPEGLVNAMTRLVLVNTIYFNASWADPFNPELTREDPFKRLDGTEVRVPTMHQLIETRYAEGPGYRAAELSYDGGQLGMVVIVPDEGSFEAIEVGFDAARVSAIRADLLRHSVELSFPKFEFRSSVMAKAPLQALGMTEAFTGAADLSGMTGERDLLIQDVVHEAFVAVDETGTEAAAATAVVVGEVSIPPPATLRIDRPFIFAIIDRPTGATLFVGRVVDPSK